MEDIFWGWIFLQKITENQVRSELKNDIMNTTDIFSKSSVPFILLKLMPDNYKTTIVRF